MTNPELIERRPKTKIICTLGPQTESQDAINELVESGMSIARLNFSHGTIEEHKTAVERVRKASKHHRIPIGIMVDVPGLKYRTGQQNPGEFVLKVGDEITLTTRDVVGNKDLLTVLPPGIHIDTVVGNEIQVDDGHVVLRVLEKNDLDVRCEVLRGSRMTAGRGVTIPGMPISLPFPDEKAIQAIEFAADHEADFIALSNVTTADDIKQARDIFNKRSKGKQKPFMITKVERSQAIDNFDNMLAASDGIMVARGDMGVQIPLSRVPIVQKELIRKSNIAGKPVITATQMLESMIESQIPTRAEVTDVANAVFDGTDAIMLSGETSIGKFPIDAVRVMAQTALEAEGALPYESIIRERWSEEQQTDDAISYGAVRTALQLNASLIVAFTELGGTGGRVSKYRPKQAILALTPDDATQRRLTIRWGVIPIVVTGLETVDDFFETAESQAVEIFDVKPDSNIVLVMGFPMGISGGTNLMRVMKISSKNCNQ